jgi:hypothetical protein
VEAPKSVSLMVLLLAGARGITYLTATEDVGASRGKRDHLLDSSAASHLGRKIILSKWKLM